MQHDEESKEMPHSQIKRLNLEVVFKRNPEGFQKYVKQCY